MMFVLGIVLFALAILLSVALHECGHMWVARATGMKVRRYFVGFGPTLWSTLRPNKLRLHRVRRQGRPAGRLLRHRRYDVGGGARARRASPYAMYKQKTWKRVAVLFAGPGDELRHRPGADLCDRRRRGGCPTCIRPTHADRRRNRLRGTGSLQGQAGRLHRARPGRAGRHPSRRRDRQGRWHTGEELRRVGHRRAQGQRTRHRSSCERTQDGHTDEFTTTVDVTPTQRWAAKDEPARTRARADRAHHRRCDRRRRRIVRADAVQPAVGGARHLRVHRRSGRRAGQVAGEDPDQGRCAGARDRRRRA